MSSLLLLVVCSLLLSLASAQSSSSPNLTFTTVSANSAFSPREYAACTQTTATTSAIPTLYFFGGFYVNSSFSDVYYNDAWSSADFGTTWTQITNAAAFPAQAWNGAVVTQKGIVYIGGGGDNNNLQNNQVWFSSNNGATFTLSSTGPFDARENAGIAGIPGSNTLVLALGNTRNDYFVDDIWVSTDGQGANWTQVCSGASNPPCPLTNQYGNETAQVHGPTLVGLSTGAFILAGGYGSFTNGSTSWVSNQVAVSSNNFQSWSTYTAPWSPRSQQRAQVDTDNYVYFYGGVYNLPATSPSQIYYNYFTDVWYSTNAASSNPTWTQLGSYVLGNAGYSGVSYANNPNTPSTGLYTNGVVFNPCLAFGWVNGQKTLALYTGVLAGYHQVNPEAVPAWPGLYRGVISVGPSSSTGSNIPQSSTGSNTPQTGGAVKVGAEMVGAVMALLVGAMMML